MDKDSQAIITNVQRFSTEDGPGIRTTVFFKGCPLKCPWCHNPEGMLRHPELAFTQVRCISCGECMKVCPEGVPIPGQKGSDKCRLCFECVDACPSTAREKMGREYTVDELFEELIRDRVFYEKSGGGVTASGGEPMSWPGFLADIFRRLRDSGIHTALDTSGAVGGNALKRVLDKTDLVLLDLKIMDEQRHSEILGADLGNILENIRVIDSTGIPLILRVPVVPGYTDSDDNIEKIAAFCQGLHNLQSVELLAFHQLGESKYRRLGKNYTLSSLAPPDNEKMQALADIFKNHRIQGVKTK